MVEYRGAAFGNNVRSLGAEFISVWVPAVRQSNTGFRCVRKYNSYLMFGASFFTFAYFLDAVKRVAYGKFDEGVINTGFRCVRNRTHLLRGVSFYTASQHLAKRYTWTTNRHMCVGFRVVSLPQGYWFYNRVRRPA